MHTPNSIIDETVKWYETDVRRRAVVFKRSGSTVHYKTPDGRTCPMGRVMTLDGIKVFGRSPAPADAVLEQAYDQFREDTSLGDPQWCLHKPYRGWSKEFWFDLQKLHDIDKFWDRKGLTTAGLQYLSFMRTKYDQPEQHKAKSELIGK